MESHQLNTLANSVQDKDKSHQSAAGERNFLCGCGNVRFSSFLYFDIFVY